MCNKLFISNNKWVTRLVAGLIFTPALSLAGPTGGNVVGGSGSISQQQLTTTINQASNRLAIEWQTFNVAENESVQFIQPHMNAIALNRILDQNPSQIFGRIDANGHIVLVNPRGVLFGRNATVNAGGIIASALDIDSNRFMNGEFYFSAVDNTEGQVINHGLLNAATGGSVSLLGKSVVNDGLISARLGTVNLASGTEAVLTFDADGMIGVEVTQAVLENDLGIDSAILNSGEIDAAGGRVLMTAKVSRDLFSNAVNNEGLVRATGIEKRNGKIVLLGKGADVSNSGTLDVSSREGNAGSVELRGENIHMTGRVSADTTTGNGGSVYLESNNTTTISGKGSISAASESGTGGDMKILGDYIALLDNASIDASGGTGGGTVLIGGDQQGLNPGVHNAQGIYLGVNTAVNVDATENGDGGTLITFAEEVARLYGLLSARGGALSGNGGFIETSGKQYFEILNAPLVSAANGSGGYWLIDPYNIEITDINPDANENIDESTPNLFLPSDTVARLDIDSIYDALDSGNGVTVEVTTENAAGTEDGNITFSVDLDFDQIGSGSPPQADTLILTAANDIYMNSRIYDSNNRNNTSSNNISRDILNVELDAGNAISFGANGSVETGGGYFLSDSVSFDSSAGEIITSGGTNQAGGDIDITTTGGDLLLGNVLSSATNIAVRNVSNDGELPPNDSPNETNAHDQNGADGGDITLISNDGNIVLSGTLDASGAIGDGFGSTGRRGGDSGNIIIDANGDGLLTGNLQLQGVLANGGNGDARNSSQSNGGGGAGGDVEIEAAGTISLAGWIEAQGGERDDLGTDPIDGAGGNITFNGVIQETADVTVSTGTTAGDITFLQDIQDADSGLRLIAGEGGITLGGDTTLSLLDLVSADAGLSLAGNLTTQLALNLMPVDEIYIDATSVITSSGVIRTDNNFIVAASSTETYDLSFGSPVRLTGNVNIDSGSNGGSVSFLNTVNSNTSTRRDLVIDAGTGDITFNNAIGSNNSLRDLNLAADDINFLGGTSVLARSAGINNDGTLNFTAGTSFTVTGGFNQIGLGGVYLGAGTSISGDIVTFGNTDDIGNALAQPVTVASGFNSSIDSDNNNIIFNKGIVSDGGGASFLLLTTSSSGSGDIQLLDVDLEQLAIASGGDLILSGNIDLNSAFNATGVGGNITVNNDSTIQTANSDITTDSPIVLNGDLTLDTGTGAGNISVAGTVNGNGSLSASAGNGNVILGGDMGTASALDSVDINGANINLAGDIVTTGLVNLDGPVNLNGDVAIDTTDAGGSAAGADVIVTANLTGNGNDLDVTAGNAGQVSMQDINGVVNLDITAADASVANIDATGTLSIAATTYALGSSIVAANGITLAGDGVSQNGSVIQSQSGSVTQQGSLQTSSGNFQVSADNNISIALLDAGTGNVDLNAATGEIIDNNGDVLNISANTATLIASDGIGDANGIETDVNSLLLQNDNNGDINIDDAGSLTVLSATNTANPQGNIAITSNGSITLAGEVTGNGNVVFNSGGSYQQNPGANITAVSMVDIDSAGDIFQNADITLSDVTGNVDVTSASGRISMSNARTYAPDGIITYIASGNVDIDTLDAIYEQGDVYIESASGNIAVTRSGSDSTPHVISDIASLTASGGNGIIGLPNRLIYLEADRVFITAAYSNYRIVGTPTEVSDRSQFFAGLIETKAEVGGSQRLEVESLAVIDPAVFSKVRNFRVDNYAVRLPDDQLIIEEEDDDEKRNKQDPDIFDEEKPFESDDNAAAIEAQDAQANAETPPAAGEGDTEVSTSMSQP